MLAPFNSEHMETVCSSEKSLLQELLCTAFAAWTAAWKASKDEHAAELERAVQAASAWRKRLLRVPVEPSLESQGDSANGFAGIVSELALEAVATGAMPDETQSKDCMWEPGSGDEDKGKLWASRAPSVSTTASSDRETDGDLSGCAQTFVRRRSGGEASAGTSGGASCWVVAAPAGRVRDILTVGLGYDESRLVGTAPSKELCLRSGPWGRTGLARRGEDVLVYVDVLRAMMEGTQLSFRRRGVMLCAGCKIPPRCIRKITRIVDGELLHESE